jgi:hypothetical protein
MAWFFSSWLFLATTLCITIVLYRRDFHSPVLVALKDVPGLNKGSDFPPFSDPRQCGGRESATMCCSCLILPSRRARQGGRT